MSSESAVAQLSWRWTRPSHLSQAQFLEFQPKLHALLEVMFDKFIYQLESLPWGEDSKRSDGANDHYGGYGHVKKKVRPGQLGAGLQAALDEEKSIAPAGGVYMAPSSKPGIAALKAYSMKAETRFAGPWMDKSMAAGCVLNDKFLITTLRPWQQTLLEMLQKEPDDRTIICVVDPDGGTGKSAFAKYLARHHNSFTLFPGSINNVLFTVSENLGRPIYVMNVTKCLPHDFKQEDLLHILELIKDGDFLSGKYTSKVCRMNHPHVVLFTNSIMNPAKLSKDRTAESYYTIEDQKLMHAGEAWIADQRETGRMKAFLYKVKKDRENKEFKEYLAAIKSGEGCENDKFHELACEILGAPPPKRSKPNSPVAAPASEH